MSAQLLIARSQVATSVLPGLVPPQCSEGAPYALRWDVGEDASLVFELVLPPALLKAAKQIIPCFSCLAPQNYAYQFSLEFETVQGGFGGATWLSPIGRIELAAKVCQLETPPVQSAIDVLVLEEGLAAATLKLRVFPAGPEDLQVSPALVSVSISSSSAPCEKEKISPEAGVHIDIPVPSKSQMEQDPNLGPRICSPTSVSMVLDYYGRKTDPLEVASVAYHLRHDLYGIWPAALYAASRWGLLGYLLEFPSWDAVQWLLDRRIPVVASICYQEGELQNAAIAATAGHLVVVRGYSADTVQVNDPAADSAAEVCRLYARREFEKVWLERTAVGYVIFPPAGPSQSVDDKILWAQT